LQWRPSLARTRASCPDGPQPTHSRHAACSDLALHYSIAPATRVLLTLASHPFAPVYTALSWPSRSKASSSKLLLRAQYTGDWVILERMTRDCTLVDDPRLADFFLVPFLFGTLSAADWQRCYPLKRMLKKALKRVISGAMLVHLNRTTASRHVFLCSTDGQFCPATFGQGDLQNATIVHLGDDNVWGNHIRNRYELAARQKGQGVVWHNALTVPHRVSQWLPPFARPNPLAPRPLLLSGNVNLNRSQCHAFFILPFSCRSHPAAPPEAVPSMARAPQLPAPATQ